MKRKTAIPKRMPRPADHGAAERAYFKLLRKYSHGYITLLRAGLNDIIPGLLKIAGEENPVSRSDAQRMDENIEERLRKLFEWVDRRMDIEFSDEILTKWARSMVGLVNVGVKKSTIKTAQAVGLEIDPLMRDAALTKYFQNVVDENVGLIRSISRSQREPLKNALVAMITADAPHDQIREMLEEKFGVPTNKARLIARDQIGKLNGTLNQYRQESLGGTGYYWRRNKDGRCRKRHDELGAMSDRGKVFKWSNPPIVDKKTGRRAHPGQSIQCRCTAEMYLGDVVS
jgi:SPP1 gp7 family putative phage head morphogenesis protein